MALATDWAALSTGSLVRGLEIHARCQSPRLDISERQRTLHYANCRRSSRCTCALLSIRFFHRQVCCRCRDTIQETVKNGRHGLLGYSSRCQKSTTKVEESHKFDQSSGRMISKVQLQTGGGVYGKFGRRKGAGI